MRTRDWSVIAVAFLLIGCGAEGDGSETDTGTTDPVIASPTPTPTPTPSASAADQGPICALLDIDQATSVFGHPVGSLRGASRPDMKPAFAQCVYNAPDNDFKQSVTVTVTTYASPEEAHAWMTGVAGTSNLPRPVDVGDEAFVKGEFDAFQPLGARFGAHVLSINSGANLSEEFRTTGETILREVSTTLQELLD